MPEIPGNNDIPFNDAAYEQPQQAPQPPQQPEELQRPHYLPPDPIPLQPPPRRSFLHCLPTIISAVLTLVMMGLAIGLTLAFGAWVKTLAEEASKSPFSGFLFFAALFTFLGFVSGLVRKE